MPYHVTRFVALSTVLLAGLAGCSSQDDASVSNFQNVLQTYYDSKDEPATCIAGMIDEFPYAPDKSRFSWGHSDKEEQLEALTAAGLIEQPKADTYQLTDTGQSAFQPDDGFCFGNITVAEVTNFTEPSERGGFTISQVNYRAGIEERPDWSRNEKLVDTFGLSESGLRSSGIISRDDNPEQKKMVLVKTNDGWITEREM